MAFQARADAGEVVGDQAVDQLDDGDTFGSASDQIGPLLEGGDAVSHGHTAFAGRDQGVVVLRVADRDDVVGRVAEFLERRQQARRLVDPGRQDHHRFLVEDDLEFQAQLVDGAQDGRLERLDRGDDDMTGRHGRGARALSRAANSGGGGSASVRTSLVRGS